ncbi:hypothetical protein C8Q70DRAFT_61357 [Cubamyces menziesii]|nr:hypothetical protein C8Q70DRAFT_61357 [Cubamyces menziesii]
MSRTCFLCYSHWKQLVAGDEPSTTLSTPCWPKPGSESSHIALSTMRLPWASYVVMLWCVSGATAGGKSSPSMQCDAPQALFQCEPAKVTWQGGKSPYTVVIFTGVMGPWTHLYNSTPTSQATL